jgi:hypothetical protein
VCGQRLTLHCREVSEVLVNAATIVALPPPPRRIQPIWSYAGMDAVPGFCFMAGRAVGYTTTRGVFTAASMRAAVECYRDMQVEAKAERVIKVKRE